ncbi:MAG: sporulation protein YqfD [Ruminococcaceae bacterium]|nr:sporulation protein YqfD [Oscillospiraceae bacterium]
MLLTRLFHFLGGYLTITVSGQYPERFLNVCAKRGILIWDVFPCSSKVLRCSISIRGFRLLRPIAKKTAVHVKIIKKQGLPVLLSQYKKRKLFLSGLGLFILIFIAMNQFIWKIEVTGCENVSQGYVLERLAECGLKTGSFRPFLNEQKLKNEMLIKTPELAWIWADKSGSKVVVEVKERTPVPEIYDKDAFCNIIAAKDGVIDLMIVKNGAPMVALGDTVQKGDILVSGMLVSDKGVPPRTVQSEAEIYARVWYEKNRAYSLLDPIKTETGETETKYTLSLFGWELRLFKREESQFSHYLTETDKKELTLFGRYLGLALSSVTYKEVTITYERLTAESVAQSSTMELLREMDEEVAPGSKLTDSRASHQAIDEETIEVTVVAEYLENIAKKTEILSQEGE